ncbi:hypothetical protein BASA83_009726 [Batrachochytrium salamandrivorans]|nr:hypothetical protein BASA62_007687 [Batrachochytrium salamandrivorans]KAH9267787.1 hypothetical protein BASA83_009726 [Batrachochytrium salamandrivorans]
MQVPNAFVNHSGMAGGRPVPVAESPLPALLTNLCRNCSIAHMKEARDWIFSTSTTALHFNNIGLQLVLHSRSLPPSDFDSRLHLLYFFNDLLFYGTAKNHQGIFESSFVDSIVPALAMAVEAARYHPDGSFPIASLPDRLARLNKLLDIWQRKNVLQAPLLEHLRRLVLPQPIPPIPHLPMDNVRMLQMQTQHRLQSLKEKQALAEQQKRDQLLQEQSIAYIGRLDAILEERKYDELPPSLMLHIIQRSNLPPWTPVPIAALVDESKRRDTLPTNEDWESILTEFDVGIKHFKSKAGTAFKQSNDMGVIPRVPSDPAVVPSSQYSEDGWETGYLDTWIRQNKARIGMSARSLRMDIPDAPNSAHNALGSSFSKGSGNHQRPMRDTVSDSTTTMRSDSKYKPLPSSSGPKFSQSFSSSGDGTTVLSSADVRSRVASGNSNQTISRSRSRSRSRSQSRSRSRSRSSRSSGISSRSRSSLSSRSRSRSSSRSRSPKRFANRRTRRSDASSDSSSSRSCRSSRRRSRSYSRSRSRSRSSRSRSSRSSRSTSRSPSRSRKEDHLQKPGSASASASTSNAAHSRYSTMRNPDLVSPSPASTMHRGGGLPPTQTGGGAPYAIRPPTVPVQPFWQPGGQTHPALTPNYMPYPPKAPHPPLHQHQHQYPLQPPHQLDTTPMLSNTAFESYRRQQSAAALSRRRPEPHPHHALPISGSAPPLHMNPQSSYMSFPAAGSAVPSSGSGGGGLSCYRCGMPGHLARDCSG